MNAAAAQRRDPVGNVNILPSTLMLHCTMLAMDVRDKML
jgi:hypothetical protein